MTIRLVHDIVEANGKTIRENNLEKIHNIPIGALVECTTTGIRAFVAQHMRDCDGTPLYSLTIHEIRSSYQYDGEDREEALITLLHKHELLNGYSERTLVVINVGN